MPLPEKHVPFLLVQLLPVIIIQSSFFYVFYFLFLFRLLLLKYVMLLEIRERLSERSWEKVNSSLKGKLINGSVMQQDEKWTPRERNSATWPKHECQFCTN
jgi:hypothetical protein